MLLSLCESVVVNSKVLDVLFSEGKQEQDEGPYLLNESLAGSTQGHGYHV